MTALTQLSASPFTLTVNLLNSSFGAAVITDALHLGLVQCYGVLFDRHDPTNTTSRKLRQCAMAHYNATGERI